MLLLMTYFLFVSCYPSVSVMTEGTFFAYSLLNAKHLPGTG